MPTKTLHRKTASLRASVTQVALQQLTADMVQTTERRAVQPTGVDVGAIVQAAADLETQGWAVIPDVLTPRECEAYVSGAWEWLASLETGIRRDDPKTWGDDRWPSSFRGIINTLEVSHQDFVWRVRQNPRILQVRQ